MASLKVSCFLRLITLIRPTFGSGNLDVCFVSAGQKVVAITRRSYGGVHDINVQGASRVNLIKLLQV